MSIYSTDECVQCGICAYYCPESAIDFVDEGTPIFDESLCNQCGDCSSTCPADSIIIDFDNGGDGDSTFVFNDTLFLDVSAEWLGMPFNSGDEGPDSTDCSGLIWGVYNDMGYIYTRCYTGDFINSPNWYQVDSLQNGDIVVWPGIHSGIYFENGSNNLFYAGSNGVGWSTVNSLINWFANHGVTELPIYFRYQP